VYMRSLKILAVLSLGVWALFTTANPASLVAQSGSGRIDLLDDCDPRIAGGWNTATDLTQCVQEEGAVTRTEFNDFRFSPLSLSVVGHPSWTIAPTFATAEPDERLRVRNAGGRGHTFTEVAAFGGGFLGNPPGSAPINQGLTIAEECRDAVDDVIPPGGRITVSGLGLGNHKFQCCIHPWMRAVVKVQPEEATP
jgi:hypothetical protein